MCQLCFRKTCPGSCPNAEEMPLIAICRDCGSGIYLGDEYYRIVGESYCEDCICDMRVYTYV
ncbi:MAG: hypothetical protein LBU77_03685 [Clostridiales bacterium]|nr:hypothetical protein [Clostridiales bacterium]